MQLNGRTSLRATELTLDRGDPLARDAEATEVDDNLLWRPEGKPIYAECG